MRFHWWTKCLLDQWICGSGISVCSLEGLWYIRCWSVLSYFSISICYMKKPSALDVREGAWYLLIFISGAQIMKFQHAPPQDCINMLWWLCLSSVLSWEMFSPLFKRRRGGKFHILAQLCSNGCIFKVLSKPILQPFVYYQVILSREQFGLSFFQVELLWNSWEPLHCTSLSFYVLLFLLFK